MRILYIHSTMVPPPVEQEKNPFFLLSKDLEGDVLQPIWLETREEIEALFGPGSYPVYTVGRFRFHWFPTVSGKRAKSRMAGFWFYLKTGSRVIRERGIGCIVAYSHMTTALCGALLKLVTGAKFICEIMIAPERTYLIDRPQPTIAERFWHLYSTVCLYLTVLASDRVHLLFEGQLRSYPLLRGKPASVFHDFTSLRGIAVHRQTGEDHQVLVAGFPWYRKGIDLAIAAFRRLAADFPSARLKVVGHFTDGEPQRLAAGCSQIDVLKAIPHDEMMRIVNASSIMILPSRNEGLPRILIEGMAAGLPLIGSDIAGIPSLIRHGENGFVVPDGDSLALEQRLRELLSDASLRRRMGQRSYELAQATLTEKVYAEQFARMIADTMQDSRSAQPLRETA